MRREVRAFWELRDRPVVWWTLALLALVEQVADVGTTLLTASSSPEANLVALRLMTPGGWPVLIGAKLLLALALLILLGAFAATPALRRSQAGGVALCSVGLLTLLYALILGNNLAVWLVTTHLVTLLGLV